PWRPADWPCDVNHACLMISCMTHESRAVRLSDPAAGPGAGSSPGAPGGGPAAGTGRYINGPATPPAAATATLSRTAGGAGPAAAEPGDHPHTRRFGRGVGGARCSAPPGYGVRRAGKP